MVAEVSTASSRATRPPWRRSRQGQPPLGRPYWTGSVPGRSSPAVTRAARNPVARGSASAASPHHFAEGVAGVPRLRPRGASGVQHTGGDRAEPDSDRQDPATDPHALGGQDEQPGHIGGDEQQQHDLEGPDAGERPRSRRRACCRRGPSRSWRRSARNTIAYPPAPGPHAAPSRREPARKYRRTTTGSTTSSSTVPTTYIRLTGTAEFDELSRPAGPHHAHRGGCERQHLG